LGCLFGEFITNKNVDEATFFFIRGVQLRGLKSNPGVDLLIAAPWDIVVMNSFIQDDQIPELTGVMPESVQAISSKKMKSHSQTGM
jgi:hypothetical protein